jgi:hypothetical protein
MAGARSQNKEGIAREARYKAIAQAKRHRVGRHVVVRIPRCARCFERHVLCPGPEVDEQGDWDFSKKCLRCGDMTREVVCDFHGKRTTVYVSILFRHFNFICYTLQNGRITNDFLNATSPKHKLEKMTVQEQQGVKKVASYSKAPRLSKHKQPPQPASNSSRRPTSSTKVEFGSNSTGFGIQVPGGPCGNEVNNAVSGTNFFEKSFNEDVQEAREEQGVFPPRYPSPTAFQLVNPVQPVDNSTGFPYNGHHPRFELNDDSDVMMHEVQQDRHKIGMEATLEQLQGNLRERDAGLDSKETQLKIREARIQEIENFLQDWEDDLQERAAHLDMREAALQQTL